MRMALPAGRRTGRSPATHVPIGDPSADVKVADVISGSPCTNVQPLIHPLWPPTTVPPPAAAPAAAAPEAPAPEAPAPEAPAAPRSTAPGAPVAPVGPLAPTPAPAGLPPSPHATNSAISNGDNVGSLANIPKPRAACHTGIRRVSACSLIARAHGRTSSYVTSGIGADPPGPWQFVQCA